jgi:Protein of unknown function (DUF664)
VNRPEASRAGRPQGDGPGAWVRLAAVAGGLFPPACPPAGRHRGGPGAGHNGSRSSGGPHAAIWVYGLALLTALALARGRARRVGYPGAGVVRQVGQLVEDDIGAKGGDCACQRHGVEDVADDRLCPSPASRPAWCGDRVIPATACPAAISRGTRRMPMTPLAPARKIRMTHSLCRHLAASPAAAGRGVRHTWPVSIPFPEPTSPKPTRAEVFLSYLDYFRSQLVTRLDGLPSAGLRASRLPSGWTPIELLKHLAYVEMRWLEWGFEGRHVADPWGDRRDDRWYVAPGETLDGLVAALHAQAARTRAIVESHDLAEAGQPGERWDGADPPALERILFHLLQEYARHLGHLDIVTELAGGPTGE